MCAEESLKGNGSCGFSTSSGHEHPSVMCLMVTHNGEQSIAGSIQSIQQAASWIHSLYVIDNASSDQTCEVLRTIDFPGLHIRVLPENQGVAAAFNLGLQAAMREGVRWLFVLDQDSRCLPGCLESLCSQAESLIGCSLQVGAVCPSVYSRQFRHILHPPYVWDGYVLKPIDATTEKGPVNVHSGISSGTLYLVQALDQIGGFREDFFIDFVDHECHLRLLASGWSMWWIPGAELEHELGVRQEMTPEGLWIEHAPYRYYYMVRNMLEGYWQHGGFRSVWSFLPELWRHCGKLRRLGGAYGPCMAYMLKGMVHVMIRRFGPLRNTPDTKKMAGNEMEAYAKSQPEK